MLGGMVVLMDGNGMNSMNPNILQNIKRKSAFIDDVQFVDGKPLFSWIDINPTELCNRLCVFCPRVNPDVYPNQKLHISLDLIRKITSELENLAYKGGVVLCGYGEPLLHPKLLDIVKILGKNIHLEIVTNGDKLTPALVKKLIDHGVDHIVVSMYDGPHQIEIFNDIFAKAGCPASKYLLRDRWHTEVDSFGLKLTNRAGTVAAGMQSAVDIHKPCYYTHYSMTVDWNGDVLLCVQDWQKRVKMGNLYAQSLHEVWLGSQFSKYRSKLGQGKRILPPCNACNTDGTMHGFNHVKFWRQHSESKG